MEKVRFGKTELMVSKVAFGGIPIMRLPKAEAASIVREAIELGINFIDTANVYTDSEEKIGEAIKGVKREDLIIATKSMAPDKKTCAEQIDLSLKRLGVDYIDIFQLHNISSEDKKEKVFAPDGAMEALEDALKAGKVRFPGFTSHNIQTGIAIMKSEKFCSVQLPFNYIDHEAANEAIPLAKKLDMGFIVMKPMGGGFLDDAGLIFRFFNSYDSVLPIPGIEKIEEIREIVTLVKKNEALTEEDKKEIKRQREECSDTWCHRCDYCLPCPQDIFISGSLWVESGFKRIPADRAKSMFGPSLENARNCTDCRLCVHRCPYKLDIPKLLKERLKFWDSLPK
jgi:predicted aldo/keto reductase-like oxidoreductase